uniref:GPI inositol-deacylase n=1 Tax=Leucosporidium scottii TaxID=5278 RepID=A0A0H5FTL3_9BASI|nr:hypothetical protein ls5930a1_00072 [Leucosporidium scottii]
MQSSSSPSASTSSASIPVSSSPTSKQDSPPASPFSVTPPSLSKPPLARLQSSFQGSATSRAPSLSPLYLDSLTRARLPSSSVSESVARHPVLSSPKTDRPPLLPGSNHSPPHARKALGGGGRSRSASAGSLKSLLEREKGGRGVGSLSLRRTSGASSSETLPPIEDGAEHSQAPGLDQLSWGTKWWPFAVVEPSAADVKGKGRATEPDDDGAGLTEQSAEEDPHASARGFMSLFGGQGPVSHAQVQREAARAQDKAEDELLEADLDSLAAAAASIEISDTPTKYREADEGSPKSYRTSTSPSSRRTSSSSPRKPTSFLPTSVFSSASTSHSPPLDGPSSLFSSFSLSNPFAPPSKLQHARRYSTSSKQNDDDGPTAKRSEVERFLDEEDTQAAKEEDDHHMDVFSLIKDRYRCPKYPIVFCHGLFGFDVIGPSGIKPLQFAYWIGIREALEAMGVEVLIGRVPASASIEERAKVLCELIEENFPGREVNLIGHSMGGLDGRFLISRLQPTTFKVRSLTTISTPHRGSSFADYLLEDIVGTTRVPALLNLMSTVGVPGGGKAFDDLTTTKMARFNDETPDDPKVKYFSYGAEFEPGWSNVFRVPWGVVHEREGANDGLVSIESAKWGQYQATLNNVNHLDLVGWVGKVRYGWAEWLGKPIKFKPVSFFCAVAEMLADEDL